MTPKESKLQTVAISLVSLLVGALASQTLDFFKTRQLEAERQRTAAEERLWNENGEMYRQLYAFRGRLIGSLNRHHFAIIEKEYMLAHNSITRTVEPSEMAIERDKRIQERLDNVLRDRADLEQLLGWADLAAPDGDSRWPQAIHGLLALARWQPSPAPRSSLTDLEMWRSREAARAQNTRTEELNKKFGTLLALIKEQRKHLRHAPPT
ncbi:MAG: hypothetical protein JO197_21045 [Acidobacteria bacterium]|nr:hypothetical protein [Acidobacteriota bacterium]MBV9476860.1 hypothetical protein [Acidobacteriota bacterium]